MQVLIRFIKQYIHLKIDNPLILLQKVFNEAISSLLESGIYQKIEKDIITSKAHRGHFNVFWAPEKLRSNEPFTIEHAIPAFLVFGLGLTTASTIFLLEFLRKKKINRTSGSTRSSISKADKGDLRGKIELPRDIEDAKSSPYPK